jgi:hypothetical protein
MYDVAMTDDMEKALLRTAREQIDAVRAERSQLAELIRQSNETILRSQELLGRLDAILARLEPDNPDGSTGRRLTRCSRPRPPVPGSYRS